MKKVAFLVVLAVAASANAVVYTGSWSNTWTFDSGLDGWAKTAGSGAWVNPAVNPNGPTLPDGGVSKGGAANLYSPDGTVWERPLATATNSFVIQADFYVPNLMPLNLNGSLPGNGIQGTGVGARFVVGDKLIGAGGRANPDGVRMKDKSWDNTDRERSWLMEEAGVLKANMWDKWVTVQLNYNFSSPGKFTAAVYTPWDSGVHVGPGWYQFAEYNIHGTPANQFINTLRLGAVVPDAASWTQTQIDNVKFVPEPASALFLVLGGLFVARRRR